LVLFYNKKHYVPLVDFINNFYNPDFYITENNQRFIVKDYKTLSKLLKKCYKILICEEDSEVKGLLAIWKAIGGDKKRYYLKINAKDEDICEKLITVLLWNSNNEFFIKINKESSFIRILMNKGFKFFHGRGREILLRRAE